MTFKFQRRQHYTAFSVQEKIAIVTLTNVSDDVIAMWTWVFMGDDFIVMAMCSWVVSEFIGWLATGIAISMSSISMAEFQG